MHHEEEGSGGCQAMIYSLCNLEASAVPNDVSLL